MSGVEGRLAGKVSLVTGASGDLGRAIALALAREGAELVLSGRQRAKLEATAGAIVEATGRPALVVAADVSSPSEVARLRSATEARFGPAAILVNAAGVFGPLARFSETDPARWVDTLLVNAVGPYLTCRALVPGMLAAGWGRIVNLSSAASLYEPGPLDSAYSTAKAALNRMTRHLASELAGTGVAAVVIHPGSVKTEMWADIAAQVAPLGEEGALFRAWVDRVDRSGGDRAELAAELVLELVDPAGAGRNGEFCWLPAGLDPPVESW